jgi:hypothetical protein
MNKKGQSGSYLGEADIAHPGCGSEYSVPLRVSCFQVCLAIAAY